ncbi:MAG: phosphoenolpyruvate carboxylase [Candidatus Omnitrophica bacterium]|nr:phosphoenolpyruvate carboxylase [Candidatus Omnitrophota bacterium]
MTRYASRSFISGDWLLRRDIRLLGWMLRDIVRSYSCERVWDDMTVLRDLARQRRDGDESAGEALRARISEMDDAQLLDALRALGLFFDLANAAEDQHRIRIIQNRKQSGELHETLDSAVRRLETQAKSREEIQSALENLDVELVLTAHPTEAKRRSVRRVLRRLRNDLQKLDEWQGAKKNRRPILHRIRRDLIALWYTDTLRPRRPTVLEELERVLFAVKTLWRIAPDLYVNWWNAHSTFSSENVSCKSFLRFGNWIGGDRDGNPNVTATVTKQTLRKLRRTAVRLHLRDCIQLSHRLTFAQKRLRSESALKHTLLSVKEQFPTLAKRMADIHPEEVYRQWLAYIEFRLRHSLFSLPHPDPAAYRSADELLNDILLLEKELREEGLHEIAQAEIRAWRHRVLIFGLHMMRIDIRDNSKHLHGAVLEILETLQITDRAWDEHPEDERCALFLQPLSFEQIHRLRTSPLSLETRDLIQTLSLIQRYAHEYDPRGIGTFIISMTHHPSDVLAMLWLNQLSARWSGYGEDCTPVPIVPLFETIHDLKQASRILDRLLSYSGYRDYVRKNADRQICMIGYSDSSKDGGYLIANWSLYEAQRTLAETADHHNVKVTIFHGRGGALGRGGGPEARAIRSLPPESVRGHLRITEQGEVIAERFDAPLIAHRHIEQILWATLLVSESKGSTPDQSWEQLMEKLSEAARSSYLELIHSPGFMDYFQEATPISMIEGMPIGSRPSRRTGQSSLEDLRAIPYTFAWTQSRQLINAFYGFGSAWRICSEKERKVLLQMYSEWDFFRAVVDNAELALAKCDPWISYHYAALSSSNEQIMQIWRRIKEEYHDSIEAVLTITRQSQMMESIPWLRRSLIVRNPYVDALNLIQVELLRRRRSREKTNSADADPMNSILYNGLRLSIQAIAAGLRNTG